MCKKSQHNLIASIKIPIKTCSIKLERGEYFLSKRLMFPVRGGLSVWSGNRTDRQTDRHGQVVDTNHLVVESSQGHLNRGDR